ncbi:MAG: HAD hydrolase family protein [Paracoccaceae bacterium]
MNILFHDVDGCLNAEDGQPIDDDGTTLTAAQAAGMAGLGRAVDASAIDVLVLNTGRGLDATLTVARAIGSSRLQYVLAEHGAIGFDVRQQREIDLGTLAGRSTSPEVAEAYESLADIHELLDWYEDTGRKRIAERVGRHVGILAKSANLTFVTPAGVEQERMYEAAVALIEKDSPFDAGRFVFHNSFSDGFVDIMCRIDKGHGVRLITDGEAHGPVRTFGVGNGLNDLPMLREVDVPICPANSAPEVKDACRMRDGHVSEHFYIRATVDWLRTVS